MMRVGLSHDPLRFYLSFYDVSFKKAFSNERFFRVPSKNAAFGVLFQSLYLIPFLPPPPSYNFLFFIFIFIFSFFFSFLLFFFSSFFLFFFFSFFFSSFLLVHVQAQENFFSGFGKFFSVWFRKIVFFLRLDSVEKEDRALGTERSVSAWIERYP